VFKYRYSAPPPTLRVLYDGEEIAELRHEREQYIFRYFPAFRQKGLSPLPGLPDGEPRVSFELPRFFAERIPDTQRPEIKELIRQKGISEQDKLALLAELSRRSVTDPFELVLDRSAA
jgi:HipA-like protein